MHQHTDIISSLEDELDKELMALSSTTPEPEPEPEEERSPDGLMRTEILKTLSGHANAPDASKIKEWKAKHGENSLLVAAFDQENVFVYTHLTLGQWEKIDLLRKKLLTAPGADAETSEKRIRETVVRSCVLWPALDQEFFVSCRAGLPSTLFELIMINSYFLTPQQALTLTTRL